jgi:hypothetical protein
LVGDASGGRASGLLLTRRIQVRTFTTTLTGDASGGRASGLLLTRRVQFRTLATALAGDASSRPALARSRDRPLARRAARDG